MNKQTDQHQQENNALEHCQRIKSAYEKCRRLGHARHINHNSGSYTHIPLDLWETIETMLHDDTIPEKETP